MFFTELINAGYNQRMTVPLLQYRTTKVSPKRQGLNHPSIAPYGAFTSKDGVQIIISCQNEREWRSLCENVRVYIYIYM